MIGSCNEPFSKTICSICYEDLKPIVEDLQAISICGHVFHELCLQHWFEYCSEGKKKCPVCKQRCSESNVSRLYFQTVDNSNDPNFSQKLQTHKEDPEELKLEIKRLEGRIKGLNSALESREKDLVNLFDEFSACKEQLKEEASLKNEAMELTRTINSLLDLKKQELNKLDLECYKLQERNMALTKELAAFKSRYKELNVKYETLERDEARSCKELEKAKGKVEELEKLQDKIQQLENAKEMKDNEVLRAKKASKKTKVAPSVLNEVDLTLNDTSTPQDTLKEPDHYGKTKRIRVTDNTIKSNNKDGFRSYILIDDDAPKVSVSPKRATTDDDIARVNETGQNNPLTNITHEASFPVLSSQEAEFCFSAALLAPDGTKRHLGKWCKKGRNKKAFQ